MHNDSNNKMQTPDTATPNKQNKFNQPFHSDQVRRPLTRRKTSHSAHREAKAQFTDNEDIQYESTQDFTKQPNLANNRKKLFIMLGSIAAAGLALGAYALIANSNKVRILSVTPAIQTAQEPYQDCEEVKSTSYVRNHKSGMKGAVIGGVGGGAVVGLVTHSWTGALIGAGVGAVSGDLIQRSRQPDYVAKHHSANQCKIAYRQIQVPIGYQVSYLQDNNVIQITTQHQPLIGSKVDLQQLQADVVTPAQSQLLVQQALKNAQTNVNPSPTQ